MITVFTARAQGHVFLVVQTACRELRPEITDVNANPGSREVKGRISPFLFLKEKLFELYGIFTVAFIKYKKY